MITGLAITVALFAALGTVHTVAQATLLWGSLNKTYHSAAPFRHAMGKYGLQIAAYEALTIIAAFIGGYAL